MANIQTVTLTAGVPTAPSGTVSTLDNLPNLELGSIGALPLPTGAATATGVAAIVTALGTPMQETGGTVAISNANANGRTVPGNSAPVVLNSMTYTDVAASQTAALLGATGASGDYLDGVLVVPETAAAGAVSLTDGSGSAIVIFEGGGAVALPTLAPFFVVIGAISKNGAGGWKITTGANVHARGIGNFT